jgi:hypothetical protein
MTREWFTTYCQNAAANVLDKAGKVRFTYITLKAALDAASRHCVSEISNEVLNLDDNIQKLCNSKHGIQPSSENDNYTLLLTLCNIHAAYLMVSGLWKEEPVQSGGTDEYGFEIF